MPAPAPIHSPLRGILLILCAVVLFACMDTAGKYVMTKHGVPLVATVRYGLNLILLTALMMPRHGRTLWRTKRTCLVVLRACALAVATCFAGLALQRIPVGEAVSIFYLQGFGVLLSAGYFLKERISFIGWFAAVAGFAGVLLIARPGGNLDPLGVVFALCCASISIIYVLLSRSLAKTESTMAMLFYVAIAGLLLFSIALVIDWRPHKLSLFDIGLLLFIGAASLAAHFLFTTAYRHAPASLLAPFNYFHIGFAVLAGWVVYSHVPDGWAFTGMAMIAASGAILALHTHFSRHSNR